MANIPIEPSLRNQWGIYALVLNGRIIYIGKSINLYRRLNEHRLAILKALKKPLKGYPNRKYNYIASAVKQHNDATITYIILKQLPSTDKKQLDKWETFFIQQYHPQFNIEKNGEDGGCSYSNVRKNYIDIE